MEFFGFAVNVWVAIVIGVFFIAMVIGCSFDRRNEEAPKWWVFMIGVVIFISWLWSSHSISWEMLFSAAIWAPVGYYLLIGLGYSLIEFILEVRWSTRYWRDTWQKYNAAKNLNAEKSVTDFLARYGGGRYGHEVIKVGTSMVNGGIEPQINRGELAESIGCWTIFWPFYLVSLIIGDLLTEVSRVIANLLVSVSSRLVQLAFKDVFKP